MPRDLDVAFLAIDEVQLGADLERGHVFTDRMLHRRGREETLVLGAATVRPMVERLLPGAHVVTRPRLSTLSFAGEKKLTRLPRRSAIVAFSAEEVYAIAELIRRQRGGAAVVLGALSPRTRNAQVALYQSGDVDYLVATDAIGMGLNLDVDHVAFASDRKFDGYQFRKLNPAELAQIAGRAGRPPATAPSAPPDAARRSRPSWCRRWRATRSSRSRCCSGAIPRSISPRSARCRRPAARRRGEQGLTRAPIAEDILVLEHAARDDDVRGSRATRAGVERLWEVCQVPDYRKIAPATHAELAITLYGFLMREGTIPTDWFARQVARPTAPTATSTRCRTGSRISGPGPSRQPSGLARRSRALAGVTRAVEDKLSDALHERLTERFVDRRTSVLMRRLRENTMLETEISKTGEVMVEGPRDRPARRLHVHARCLGRRVGSQGAGRRRPEGARRRDRRARHAAAQAPDDQIVLATDGTLRWLGEPVGKLIAGEDALAPARAHHRRRAPHRRAARRGAGAARSLAQDPYREGCSSRCSRSPSPTT